jgi:hypothetical protein
MAVVQVFLDLFAPVSKVELRLRRSEAKGVHIQGATEKRVASAKELLHVLTKADTSRLAGASRLKDASSRSHVILTVGLTVPAKGGKGARSLMSRAHLVDLAGSEKFWDAGAELTRQQEPALINKSLTTLDLVIATLAQQKEVMSDTRGTSADGGCGWPSDGPSGPPNPPDTSHVPYRNSKLTCARAQCDDGIPILIPAQHLAFALAHEQGV